jgi:hypothetical protein
VSSRPKTRSWEALVERAPQVGRVTDWLHAVAAALLVGLATLFGAGRRRAASALATSRSPAKRLSPERAPRRACKSGRSAPFWGARCACVLFALACHPLVHPTGHRPAAGFGHYARGRFEFRLGRRNGCTPTGA